MKRAAALLVLLVGLTAAVGGASGTSAGLTPTVCAKTATRVTLCWPAQTGAAGFVFSRDGVRLSNTWDPARTTATFARLTGSHSYGVQRVDVTAEGSVTDPPPATSASFAAASVFNQPLPANPPVHPDSATMLSAASTWLYPGPYQEWLGPRDRAVYRQQSFSSLPSVSVALNYTDAHGYGCGADHATVPIPTGWDSLLGPDPASTDRITIVTDPATGDEWEGYRVTPPGTTSMDVGCGSSGWQAVRMDYYPAAEKTGLGYGFGGGASASGIDVALGLLVPQDFPAGYDPTQPIPHRLRINCNCASSGANYPRLVPPADGGADGQQPDGIPEGAVVQLDPSIDVARWPSVLAQPEPWRDGLIRILRTLQVYGGDIVESSGCAGCGGIEAATEGSVAPFLFPWHGLGDYQRGIPYDLMGRFRVIDWTKWP